MFTEIMRLLITEYIEPVMKFSGLIIDEKGYIVPIGDPDSNYKSGEKVLRVPKDDEEYFNFKKHKDEIEIFAPFNINKHALFIASVVKERIGDMVRDDEKEEYNFIDEEEDVEYMDEEQVDKLYDFINIYREEIREDGKYGCYIQNDETKEIYGYGLHETPIFAIIMMCLDVYNKFVEPRYDLDRAIKDITSKINKWKLLRSKSPMISGSEEDIETIDITGSIEDCVYTEYPTDYYSNESEVFTPGENIKFDEMDLSEEESNEELDVNEYNNYRTDHPTEDDEEEQEQDQGIDLKSIFGNKDFDDFDIN